MQHMCHIGYYSEIGIEDDGVFYMSFGILMLMSIDGSRGRMSEVIGPHVRSLHDPGQCSAGNMPENIGEECHIEFEGREAHTGVAAALRISKPNRNWHRYSLRFLGTSDDSVVINANVPINGSLDQLLWKRITRTLSIVTYIHQWPQNIVKQRRSVDLADMSSMRAFYKPGADVVSNISLKL